MFTCVKMLMFVMNTISICYLIACSHQWSLATCFEWAGLKLDMQAVIGQDRRVVNNWGCRGV